MIDGGPVLETRPTKTNGTIWDYAKQLLCTRIIPLFEKYDRIDIVFDSDRSKQSKSFIQRHGRDTTTLEQLYDLKHNDILESYKFHEFVHRHRAKLARIVGACWLKDDLINLLPCNKVLVIAGPQDDTTKLVHNGGPSPTLLCEPMDLLESDLVEADTRLFLHVYDIQTSDDGKFDGIVVQSCDTDVFILSLAHINLITLSKCFLHKIVASTRSSTFINIKEIGESSKRKWNIAETTVFLALHALSGCDTTSFIRNTTKANYFMTYLHCKKNPQFNQPLKRL